MVKEKSKKCYFEYNRREKFEILNSSDYRKTRENTNILSGTIFGSINMITPLFSKGQQNVKYIKNSNNKNKLSLSTTFKGELRVTADFMNVEMSNYIFGDLIQKSNIEIIAIKLPQLKKKIEVPSSHYHDKKFKLRRLYYNQVNRIKNTNLSSDEQFFEFQSSLKKIIKNEVELLEDCYLPKEKIEFKLLFKRLNEEELLFLINVLLLDDKHFHQIGYGKNFGMGTVKIEIEKIFLDNKDKYRNLFRIQDNIDVSEKYVSKAKQMLQEKKYFEKKEFQTYEPINENLDLNDIYDDKNKRKRNVNKNINNNNGNNKKNNHKKNG